jgi:hypothetical protein
MIDTAMKFLRDYLNQELPVHDLTVLGNIALDSDITPSKIHLTLLNIEEERILKQVNHLKRVNPGDNFFTTINPEIRLNLYILVTYQYSNHNYEEALKQLAAVATILQGKYGFTKPDFIKPAYESLEQIAIELYSQTLEQNSTMWQSLGQKLAPSLVYKMRVIAIQANKALSTTGEVNAIGFNLMNK